jgi:hypothetical protein
MARTAIRNPRSAIQGAAAILAALLCVAHVDARVAVTQGGASMLQRFLARGDSPTVEYRALRHIEAENAHFGQRAWLDAWTEFDNAHGLRYEIVSEGGSGYIRSKVLRAALDAEQKMWLAKEPQKASFNHDNYTFENSIVGADGLTEVSVKPRRKDVLLVEGAIFLEADDAAIARIEGRLSKAPSFWTRKVEVVRSYRQMSGVRVPVSIESVAHVLIAGRSTFKMTYQYETINGQKVGSPQPRAQSPSASH